MAAGTNRAALICTASLLSFCLGVVAASNEDAADVVGSERSTCRATVDGHCVHTIFSAYDEMLREKWPGTVDLIVRMFAGRGYTAQPFLQSVDLFWPKDIGDVIVVLDEGEQYMREMLPSWVKVMYEDTGDMGDLWPKKKGWLLKEWSDLYLDNYTSADYIAIADTDMVLATKVTPDLLFDMASNKPIVIGRNNRAWCSGVDFFLGKGRCFNFMAALPWVVPRSMFGPLRSHILQHRGADNLRDVFVTWAETGDPNAMAAFSTMGNYMYRHMNEHFEFAIERTERRPALRYGIHVAYSHHLESLLNESGARGRPGYDPKLSIDLFKACAHYVHKGLCYSLPAGVLPDCGQYNLTEKFDELLRWEKDKAPVWTQKSYSVMSEDELYYSYYRPLWALYEQYKQRLQDSGSSSNSSSSRKEESIEEPDLQISDSMDSAKSSTGAHAQSSELSSQRRSSLQHHS